MKNTNNDIILDYYKDFENDEFINKLKSYFNSDELINVKYLSDNYVRNGFLFLYFYKDVKVEITITKDVKIKLYASPFYLNEESYNNIKHERTYSLDECKTYKDLLNVLRNINKEIDEFVYNNKKEYKISKSFKSKITKSFFIIKYEEISVFICLIVLLIIFGLLYRCEDGIYGILILVLLAAATLVFLCLNIIHFIGYFLDIKNTQIIKSKLICTKIKTNSQYIKIYVNYNNKRIALVNADKNIFSDLGYLNDGYDEYIFVFLKNSKILLAIETD